jgi:hypothetical protein
LTPETSQCHLSTVSPRPRRVRRRRERDSDIDIKLEAGSTTNESDADDPTPGKSRREKPLNYSLRRHRAVQTDFRAWAGSLSPTSYGQQCLPAFPYEGESESSSLADNPSTLGILLDHVQQLFNRIAQADARTLTTRLKRQKILGADVSYLSHSTVDGVVAEVVNLRAAFRAALEDEKFTTICTRRDLRALLKFLKDIFKELGTLRTTLNDIVLDPSIAPKVREMTLNPRDESSPVEKVPSLGSGGGWMAPLSKFFGSATSSDSKHEVAPHGVNRGRGPTWPSPRFVPKLSPATSASATTVNVEFTGTGAGRAITNVSPAARETVHDAIAVPVAPRSTSTNLMGIFAGAPRNDSWVVLPQGLSRKRGTGADQLRRSTLGRAAGQAIAGADTNAPSSLPRNVDAVIDLDPHASAEERSGTDPSRTLRTRGLSDSSIHTTFLQHGEAASPVTQTRPLRSPEATGHAGRTVLGALSQTVLGVRSVVSGKVSPSPQPAAPSPNTARDLSSHSRATSPLRTVPIPDVSSWTAASRTLNPPDPDAYVGSLISSALPESFGYGGKP